jgi:hypothetical protein
VNIYGQLGERKSRMVQDALKRRCEVCRARPGEDCTQMPINGLPLEGRLVHYARMVD